MSENIKQTFWMVGSEGERMTETGEVSKDWAVQAESLC